MMSNYPPGFSGGVSDQAIFVQKCKNGHKWEAAMYYELGGWFYFNDDDAICPTCKEDALDYDPNDPEMQGRKEIK